MWYAGWFLRCCTLACVPHNDSNLSRKSRLARYFCTWGKKKKILSGWTFNSRFCFCFWQYTVPTTNISSTKRDFNCNVKFHTTTWDKAWTYSWRKTAPTLHIFWWEEGWGKVVGTIRTASSLTETCFRLKVKLHRSKVITSHSLFLQYNWFLEEFVFQLRGICCWHLIHHSYSKNVFWKSLSFNFEEFTAAARKRKKMPATLSIGTGTDWLMLNTEYRGNHNMRFKQTPPNH